MCVSREWRVDVFGNAPFDLLNKSSYLQGGESGPKLNLHGAEWDFYGVDSLGQDLPRGQAGRRPWSRQILCGWWPFPSNVDAALTAALALTCVVGTEAGAWMVAVPLNMLRGCDNSGKRLSRPPLHRLRMAPFKS